jgi:hypothetical protein
MDMAANKRVSMARELVLDSAEILSLLGAPRVPRSKSFKTLSIASMESLSFKVTGVPPLCPPLVAIPC